MIRQITFVIVDLHHPGNVKCLVIRIKIDYFNQAYYNS
jgi:hypothetical protein